MTERLQKLIAQVGIASRRKAEKMIIEDRVAINGRIMTELGTKVEPSANIEVDGLPVQKESKHTYLLYKLRGVIFSVGSDEGRKTALGFFKESPYRLYPVGRLDYGTSGSLLITNDGELANKLTHPRYTVGKVYIVKIKDFLTPEEVYSLKRDVRTDDKKLAPTKVKTISANRRKGTSVAQLTIHEGHYHQVKRMFKAVDHLVGKLSRERYASLTLRSSTAGKYRELARGEVAELRSMWYTEAEFNGKVSSRQGESSDQLFESATYLYS